MKLSEIQKQLDAPKKQWNDYGKYKYRSCEDILEAVKPLLGDAILTLQDDIIQIGERYYIKATATFINGDEKHVVSALAREAITKKGMDDAQITGSASSYARKYALNGLFLIDDSKDSDTEEIPLTDEEIKERREGNKKEKEETIKYIESSLAVMTNGMNLQQKGATLQKYTKMKKFDAVKTLHIDTLKEIKKALDKDMEAKAREAQKKLDQEMKGRM